MLEVTISQLNGNTIASFHKNIKVTPNASGKYLSINLTESLKGISESDVFVHAEFTADKGKSAYANNYFLVKQKDVNYPKATISKKNTTRGRRLRTHSQQRLFCTCRFYCYRRC